MAALYAIWKRLSHFRLDGVLYDICGKEREDGRFSVAWVCLRCCEQGPPIPATESLDRAISFAHIGVRAHHGLMHTGLGHQLSPNYWSPVDNGSLADDDRGSGQCRKAYKQLHDAFEKLCKANEKIRSYSTIAAIDDPASSFAAACRIWNDAAHEFDEALEAYSTQLCERAGAAESKRHRNGEKNRTSHTNPPRRPK
jgi:hypothetical protein